MKDNFDLKKFLKESKAIENLNPSLKSINDKESKSLKENSLKDKIREMIVNELSEADDTADITVNRGGGASQPNNEYDFLSESDDLHEDDLKDRADAVAKNQKAIRDRREEEKAQIEKDARKSRGDIKEEEEDKDERDMEGLVKAMMANTKARRKRKEEEMKKAGLKEAEKDEDGEEMEDESREERADVDKYEFEKGKEDGEKEGGIEAIAADLDGNESDLMGSLMNALKIAKGMDNEKLEVQIGNTLKFFVSTFIDNEENKR